MHDLVKQSIIPVVTVMLGFALTFTRLETRFEESETRATQRYYMLKELVAQGNRTELAVAILAKDIEQDDIRLKAIEKFIPTTILTLENRVATLEAKE